MFDLVVAHDVLIHVIPKLIEKVWNELVRVTNRYLYVTLSEDVSDEERKKIGLGFHVFLHNYKPLLKRTPLKIIKEIPHPILATGGKAIIWFLEKRSSL